MCGNEMISPCGGTRNKIDPLGTKNQILAPVLSMTTPIHNTTIQPSSSSKRFSFLDKAYNSSGNNTNNSNSDKSLSGDFVALVRSPSSNHSKLNPASNRRLSTSSSQSYTYTTDPTFPSPPGTTSGTGSGAGTGSTTGGSVSLLDLERSLKKKRRLSSSSPSAFSGSQGVGIVSADLATATVSAAQEPCVPNDTTDPAIADSDAIISSTVESYEPTLSTSADHNNNNNNNGDDNHPIDLHTITSTAPPPPSTRPTQTTATAAASDTSVMVATSEPDVGFILDSMGETSGTSTSLDSDQNKGQNYDQSVLTSSIDPKPPKVNLNFAKRLTKFVVKCNQYHFDNNNSTGGHNSDLPTRDTVASSSSAPITEQPAHPTTRKSSLPQLSSTFALTIHTSTVPAIPAPAAAALSVPIYSEPIIPPLTSQASSSATNPTKKRLFDLSSPSLGLFRRAKITRTNKVTDVATVYVSNSLSGGSSESSAVMLSGTPNLSTLTDNQGVSHINGSHTVGTAGSDAKASSNVLSQPAVTPAASVLTPPHTHNSDTFTASPIPASHTLSANASSIPRPTTAVASLPQPPLSALKKPTTTNTKTKSTSASTSSSTTSVSKLAHINKILTATSALSVKPLRSTVSDTAPTVIVGPVAVLIAAQGQAPGRRAADSSTDHTPATVASSKPVDKHVVTSSLVQDSTATATKTAAAVVLTNATMSGKHKYTPTANDSSAESTSSTTATTIAASISGTTVADKNSNSLKINSSSIIASNTNSSGSSTGKRKLGTGNSLIMLQKLLKKSNNQS